MLILYRDEFRNNHEEWINLVKPVLDPAISSVLHEKPDTTCTDVENYKAIRNEMRSALNSLLKVIFLWRICLAYFFKNEFS